MWDYVFVDMQSTGENIIRLRKEKGLSVKDLQEIFGFSTPQAIYKWQQGSTLPTVDNLVVLAKVFHVNMEDIIAVRMRETNTGRSAGKIA